MAKRAVLVLTLVCSGFAATASAQSITGSSVGITRRGVMDLGALIGAPPPAPGAGTASSFEGLPDITQISPEAYPSGAVGSTYVLTATNDLLRVQTRSGAVVGSVFLSDFWRPVIASKASRPRLGYDPYGGRWFMAAVADINTVDSATLLAVSSGSDPLSTWYLFSIDADPLHAANSFSPTVLKIGFNRHRFAVSIRLVSNDSATYINSYVYTWDKAATYANTILDVTRFQFSHDYSAAYTYDDTVDDLYLALPISRFTAPGEPVRPPSEVSIYAVRGATGSETIEFVGRIAGSLGRYQGWGGTRFGRAWQPNNAPCVETWGEMVGFASPPVYRNGSLWLTHTVGLPAPMSQLERRNDSPGIFWWQVSPSALTLQQQGRISNPDGLAAYAFPSLSVNSRNDVLIGYQRFTPSEPPSGHYAYRAGGDPINTLRADTEFKAGEAPYGTRSPFTDGIRWGPYSATVVDPANDVDLWTLQQYSASPANGQSRWGTWWGRVAFPSAVTLQQVTGPSGGLGYVNGSLTWHATAYTPDGTPPEYKFWQFNHATGTWSMARDWSTDPDFTWVPDPSEAGGYTLQVWTKRASVSSLEDWKAFSFQIVGARVAGVSVSPSLNTQAGSPMTFTASASGASQLEYKFWMLDAVLGTWRVLRDYASEQSVSWVPSQNEAGDHLLQVWVRHVGSTADYEGFANTPSFRVDSAMPGVAAVLSDHSPLAQQGTIVRWFAVGVGGSGPLEYKFWHLIEQPGHAAVWQMVRDYSTDNSFTWSTTSADVGSNLFQVWVRRVGSAAQYEGFGNSSGYFTITYMTPPRITGMLFNPGPPFVQNGSDNYTVVTFTGPGTADSLQYKFFIYDLGSGSRVMFRNYVTESPSFALPLSGPFSEGFKQLEVWIRNPGSDVDPELDLISPVFFIRPERGCR